jgi:hypothetical protein
VVAVRLPFYPAATSAELIHENDTGWSVCFLGVSLRESVFFTRDDIVGGIGEQAFKNWANIVRYFESVLKAAGYKGVHRRLGETGSALVAVWDITPVMAA